jgi:nitroreductase
MDFLDVLAQRHSVRDFADRAVPREVLQRVVGAASFAPSAMNEQPWRFYIAEGATRWRVNEIMAQSTVHLADYMDVLGPERYEAATRWYTDLGGAPVIVCVASPPSDDELNSINRLLSVGAALENVMLAATNEGLGACVITFAFWVRDELAEALGVPEDRKVIALVALGYPGVSPEPPAHSEDIAVFRE